jgi:phosphosulfolactate synthase (CoM biosynthesis protein A)/phosphosulfolactate phosphohydrolase-like enzyme
MMNAIFDQLELRRRPGKPRTTGLTMVLDKHLGLAATQDLIQTAGQYIDVVKLGWGSCTLYPEDVLREKISLLKSNNIRVCPGGTFLEAAFERCDIPTTLRLLKATGFNAIEVSDGIHPSMTRQQKLGILKQAVDLGFDVTSEVGKKLVQEDQAISNTRRIREILEDLAAGAQKVIIEARESGTVGIFRGKNDINAELAYELFQSIDPDALIWEAPEKDQQAWLLHQLGPGVSIGNVAPQDVLSLESMRCGLRGDTFRDHCRGSRRVFLELGVAGALRAQKRGDVVVVVDAIRASATITRCIDLGAREVIPVVSATELRGEVTIGERGGAKLPSANFDNSPLSLTRNAIEGKSVVISTTNGTECIRAAYGENSVVLIGTTNNCSAVAKAAVELATQRGSGISLVAAGRNNLPAIEDRAAVTEIMQAIGNVTARGTLEPYYSENLERDFLESESGANLVQLGQAEDIIYCSRKDVAAVVPIFDGARILPYMSEALA